MADQETKDRTIEQVLLPMMRQLRSICEEVDIPMLCAVQTGDAGSAGYRLFSNDIETAGEQLQLAREVLYEKVRVEQVGINEYAVSVGDSLPIVFPSTMICH